MKYNVHTTKAFVLSVRNIGEANRLYLLLTQDVGTVLATAQSVRLERSKLRYALQTYSLTEVSLVRGKGGWRITNAYAINNLFFTIQEKQKRDVLLKVTRLLKRLLAGESPDPNLFSIIERGFNILSEITLQKVEVFELVFVSKILLALGYGTESETFAYFSQKKLEEVGNLALDEKERRSIIKEINTAIVASGL